MEKQATLMRKSHNITLATTLTLYCSARRNSKLTACQLLIWESSVGKFVVIEWWSGCTTEHGQAMFSLFWKQSVIQWDAFNLEGILHMFLPVSAVAMLFSSFLSTCNLIPCILFDSLAICLTLNAHILHRLHSVILPLVSKQKKKMVKWYTHTNTAHYSYFVRCHDLFAWWYFNCVWL